MAPTRNYGLIRSQGELDDLTGKLAQFDDPVGFDIETGYDGAPRDKGALMPEYGFIAGFSISGDPSWARYVPIRHDLAANLDPETALASIAPLSGRFVAHNVPFEDRFTRAAGFPFQYQADTLIQAYVLSLWPSNALKFLTKAVLGVEQAELISLFPGIAQKDVKKIRFNPLDPTDPAVINYACDDAALALELDRKHRPLVENNFIYKIEMALQPICVEMEEAGVLYDWRYMLEGADKCAVFLKQLGDEINADLVALTGKPIAINLGSPAQIRIVLFDELKMRCTYKSKKTKLPSTSKVALEPLRRQYPVVQKILWWKELKKLHSTYLAKYPTVYAYAEDGRTHPHIMQSAAGTGRVAVDNPPYQQTPKKYHYVLESGGTFDWNFRRAIKARPGYYLLHFDYSQIELKAITGVSAEPTLMQAFANGEDVHVATASLMIGVAKENITEEQRQLYGKTLNYALTYQMGEEGLAQRLGITNERAHQLFEQYFSSLSAIGVWVARAKERAIACGYTQTHFGRKFTIWELKSSDYRVYAKGVRLAVNAPIQGWAADFMKIAMIRQDKALSAAALKAPCSYLIMQNHDSLTYEVRNDIKPATMIKVLTPAISPPVPGFPSITVDWSIGEDWGTMDELKVDAEGNVLDVLGQRQQDDDPFDGPEDEEDEDGVAPLDIDAEKVFASVSASQNGTVEASGPAQADLGPPVGGEAGDPPASPQTIVVEIQQMPSVQQFGRFQDLLQQRCVQCEGSVVILRTPEGDVPFNWDRHLPLEWQHEVSLLFGTAKTYLDSVSVSASSVMEGIQL